MSAIPYNAISSCKFKNTLEGKKAMVLAVKKNGLKD